MTDPNRVTAEYGGATHDGRILALEGGGGLMRVALAGPEALNPGDELVLQMHDGARFRVNVIEPLGPGSEGAEFRLKLVSKER